MPIAPGPIPHPVQPASPQVVPQGQRVVPLAPARHVTSNKGAGKADIRGDGRKRRREAGRGDVLDLEV